MSIPLDRLYHYIESVAQDVYGDTLIYRFYPHGSKKIEDLKLFNDTPQHYTNRTSPEIFCNDQEPLNFDLYQNVKSGHYHDMINDYWDNHPEIIVNRNRNFRIFLANIYDKALILHSEKNSLDVEKYKNNNFIPVYYWSHALIARDWFRYAEYVKLNKQNKKLFLIYNRAWSGTREYRLKFADLLIDYNLIKDSQTSVSFNCENSYYKTYNYKNQSFKPKHILENFYQRNTSQSCYSADFDINDYQNTIVEVVLETLFDDSRNHLTEKILRPIALGQPFILGATPGSLAYLRDYGFKTFDSVFDESYDYETNPLTRLEKIISTMQEIKNWNKNTLEQNQIKMQEIATYNKTWFFSQQFFDIITDELRKNLQFGVNELEETNTSELYLNTRKAWMQCMEFRNLSFHVPNELGAGIEHASRQEQLRVVAKARSYYNRRHNK